MIPGTDELVPILLRTTGLLALSVLAVRALLGRLRPASPALWRTACVLSLLQGVLIVRLSVPVPWFERTTSASSPAPSSLTKAQPEALPDPTPRPASSPARRQGEGPASDVAVNAVRERTMRSIDRAGGRWSRLVVAGWLAGMAGLPVILLVGYIRFVVGLRTRPPDEPAWAEEWSYLLTERGIRRPIPLRVTDQLGPMLCRLPAGYRLIVPAWLWRRLDPSERQAILRHELAHYTRGDLWKSLAVRALALPHWFNPFAWWAARTFDECGEWACDDVATGPEPTAGAAYARALLQLAEAGRRLSSFGLSARGSSLATRVRRLLQPRPAAESMRTRLIIVAVLIALAAFQLVRPELMARSSRAAQAATAGTDLYGDPLPPGALARLGTVRFRPGEIIDRLAFAPDGKTLACWDGSGTLNLFEVATGKSNRRLHVTGALHVFSYLPDGRSLAVLGSFDGVVQLWDFADDRAAIPKVDQGPAFREIQVGDDQEKFGGFAVSPDGRLLAGGSSGFTQKGRMIRLWDVATGKRLDELKVVRDFDRRPDSILWLAFSPDGRAVFSLSGDPGNRRETFNKGGKGILYTWDVASGAEVRHFEVPLPTQQGYRRGMAVSPDGRLLAVGSPTKPIHLIRLTDGTELRRIDDLGGPAHVLAFSPDGTRLLSGGQDSAARIWDVATGRPLGEPIKHRNWIESIAVAPDGRTAASGGQDHMIRVWDTGTSKEPAEIPGHEYRPWSVAMSPDGATAFTSAFDDTIRIWDAATGRQRHIIRIPDRLISTALSPDGRVLAASVGRPGEMRLLDPDSGRELRRLPGHSRGFYDSLAFSRDGSRIVAAGAEDRTVRLWDVATGQSLWVFKHEEEVRAAAISPDGTIVAGAGFENRVGGAGRVIRIWDATTGRQTRELRGHKEWVNALAFSPDGKRLASGGNAIRQGIGPGGNNLGSPDLSDAIHLWDVATGADLRQFPGEVTDKWGRSRDVNALAFTPDGRTLISGEGDGSIRLYDASNAAVRATLRGHLNDVRAVSISSDGRRLVSASTTDLTGLVWDLRQAIEAGQAK